MGTEMKVFMDGLETLRQLARSEAWSASNDLSHGVC
jgi:hypothetical protein